MNVNPRNEEMILVKSVMLVFLIKNVVISEGTVAE